MRTRISDGQKQFQPAQADGGLDGERALRAAHLLQEALNLLGQGSAPSAEPASDRHDRLLRLPEVQRLTGLGRSVIYQKMRDGGARARSRSGRGRLPGRRLPSMDGFSSG